MPSLKDLHCFIELPGTDTKLQEFGTIYSDGHVETFVAVPTGPQPFEIHLSSSNFIAPGLAMYVFIDGVYQCNRNRQNLKLRKPPNRKSLIDFRVRQKEEQQKDGTMIARDWRFEKLNIETANGATGTCSANLLENVGCIELLVLRCAGTRNARSAAKASHKTKAKAMNMDGAGDEPDHHFGLDGHWDSFGASQFDDRDLQRGRGRPIAGQGSPVQPSASHHGPPPPLSPQSHLANNLQRLGGTQHAARSGRQVTRAPSTLWRSGPDTHTGHPPLTFQYGSGPIPHRTRAGSATALAPSATGGNAQAFDPNMLDHLLTKAVKQGVAEVQRPGDSLLGQSAAPTHASRYLPGAWPSSPFENTTQLNHFVAGAGTPAAHNSVASGFPGTYWGAQTAPNRAEAHTGWDQQTRSVAPTAVPKTNAWGSASGNQESWDSDESWETQKQDGAWNHAARRRGRNQSRSSWGDAMSRAKSPAVRTARSKDWQRSRSRRRATTRPRESVWESGTDNDGWTSVEAQSDTDSSWSSSVNTVRPSSSISAAVPRAAAPPGSVVSQGTYLQKKDTWGNVPTVAIPPPPGFDQEGAPGPFMDYTAVFPELKQKFDATAGWEGQDSKSRRPSSACAHGKSHGWIDNDHRPKTTKTIVTVNDESSDPEVYHRAANGKDRGTSNDWSQDMNDWGRDEDSKDQGGTKDGRKNIDIDWGTLGKDLTATANGWTTSRTKPDHDTHQAENDWQTSDRKPTTRKPRLSRNHQNWPPSTAADVTPKPHWQFPPPPSENRNQLSGAHEATLPAEPLHSISKKKAEEKGVQHQVRAGKGTKYEHYVGRPEYVDSLDKPYAVFRFKYRSRPVLKSLLDIPIPERPVLPIDSVSPYPQLKPSATKVQLQKLPQDALVDGLLKLRMKLAEKEKEEEKEKARGGEGEDRTEVVGRKRTTEWVERHSRDGGAKEKGRGRGWRKSGGGRANMKDKEDDGWGGDTESVKWG